MTGNRPLMCACIAPPIGSTMPGGAPGWRFVVSSARTIARVLSIPALAGLLLYASLSPALHAQGTAQSQRVPTVTRLVKLFLDQEDALAAAMRAGDTAALERALADDFELRTAATAANPIPRSDFLAEIAARHPFVGPAGQMAVHDLGGFAVVSFIQGSDVTRAVFVVDVWRHAGADWKLAIRYAAAATPSDVTIPGEGPQPKVIPKRY